MKKVSLTINSRKITANAGETVLKAALDNGIYIPNLCYMEGENEAAASCRLCFVEIDGKEAPVTACTEEVAEGMVVNTTGEKALRLARSGFDLLMASHPVDCAHCPANGNCELQKIARHLHSKLKGTRLRKVLRNLPVDDSNPSFTYDPNKCVLCGRCVRLCRRKQRECILGFAHRGFNRVVSTFADESIGADRCLECNEVVSVCPTGALSFKESKGKQDTA